MVDVGRFRQRLAGMFGQARPAGHSDPAPVRPSAPARRSRLSADAVEQRADEFMATVASSQHAELRTSTLDFPAVWSSLFDRFGQTYDSAAPEPRAFRHAELTCGGCGWTFPGSYQMSLLGVLGSSMVIGGTSGFAEFAKTGVCPRCRATESVLVYDCLVADDIAEEDVAAMGRLWRDRAGRWWASNRRRSAICDKCGDTVRKGAGGMLTEQSDLRCAGCLAEYLSDALTKLRENPYYFGSTELSAARRFRTG
jgi:hypothetical protein